MGWAPPSKKPENESAWEQACRIFALVLILACMVVIPIFWPLLIVILIYGGIGSIFNRNR